MKTEHLWILAAMTVSMTWILSVTSCERRRIEANEHVGSKTCQVGQYCAGAEAIK